MTPERRNNRPPRAATDFSPRSQDMKIMIKPGPRFDFSIQLSPAVCYKPTTSKPVSTLGVFEFPEEDHDGLSEPLSASPAVNRSRSRMNRGKGRSGPRPECSKSAMSYSPVSLRNLPPAEGLPGRKEDGTIIISSRRSSTDSEVTFPFLPREAKGGGSPRSRSSSSTDSEVTFKCPEIVIKRCPRPYLANGSGKMAKASKSARSSRTKIKRLKTSARISPPGDSDNSTPISSRLPRSCEKKISGGRAHVRPQLQSDPKTFVVPKNLFKSRPSRPPSSNEVSDDDLPLSRLRSRMKKARAQLGLSSSGLDQKARNRKMTQDSATEGPQTEQIQSSVAALFPPGSSGNVAGSDEASPQRNIFTQDRLQHEAFDDQGGCFDWMKQLQRKQVCLQSQCLANF